jgi:hypothetical protein
MAISLSIPKKLKDRGADIWARTKLFTSDLFRDFRHFIGRGGERVW